MNAAIATESTGNGRVDDNAWQQRMQAAQSALDHASLIHQAGEAMRSGDASAALAYASWRSAGKAGLDRDDIGALDALEALYDGAGGARAKAYAAAIHQRLGSVDKAKMLAQASAEAGDTVGMVAWGDLLARDKQEALTAARWFRRAHEAGDVTGSMRWARRLVHGVGVGRDIAQAEGILAELAASNGRGLLLDGRTERLHHHRRQTVPRAKRTLAAAFCCTGLCACSE